MEVKTNMSKIITDLHKKEIGSPEKPLYVNSDEEDEEGLPSLDGDSEEEEEENGGLPDLNDKEDKEDGGLPDVNGEGKKAPGVEGDGKDENEGGGGGAPSVRRSRKPSRKFSEEAAMKAAV